MPPILPAEDYLSLPKARENWLIKPLLPSGGSVLLYGDPKVGKSYLALQLALSVTTGTPFFGFPSLAQAGPVVYVQLDTPRSLWSERLEALRDEGHPIASPLYLADRETLQTWPFDVLRDDHANMLRSYLAPIQPAAVIIDTLREAHSRDENEAGEMTGVINRLIAITQPSSLVLVSHAKKPSEFEPNLINDNRGSSATAGKMDSIIRLTKKGLYYVGRSIEEGVIKVQRRDDGFWEEATDHSDDTIRSVMEDPSFTTDRQRAAFLAPILGKSEEAARSDIRRWKAKISAD